MRRNKLKVKGGKNQNYTPQQNKSTVGPDNDPLRPWSTYTETEQSAEQTCALKNNSVS